MSRSGPATHVHGPWEIDLARRELRANGRRILLGQRAFAILEVLLDRAGAPVSRAELMRAAWPGIRVEANTLEVHVLALRNAFGAERGLLRTLRGRGYQLDGHWRPCPAAAPAEGGNLPPAEGGLHGRQQALPGVIALLRQHRLVTLTGAPGIGKTRLAIEAARGFAQEAGLPPFLVDLTLLAEARQVPQALAEVLRPAGDGSAWQAEPLAAALAGRRALLLLDGCDPVVAETARLVHLLLTRCAGIRVLVTGRGILRIDGEQVWRVAALERLPGEAPDRALFLDRMRQAGAPPVAGAEELRMIDAICGQLDGLPLAIEWAAFRASRLGIAAVGAWLPAHLLSLGSGQRSAPPRHRSLRAALDWSIARLAEPERRLLRRLGVFPGRFTLEEALSLAGDDLGEEAVIGGIAGLAGQSLLLREDDEAGAAWRLLHPMRARARELLADAGRGGGDAAHQTVGMVPPSMT
ncbi:ATP-binding protein [Falsiroseomonas sp.]|uniref:ATP-binding protein n=1 Tax=Falsiroseomonas sp. TaxID=2870721 RepID=UPI003F72BE1A